MGNLYDVIIVGGGPTGVALGIELGMNNIKTLILEKYDKPLLSPRAQSLNERSMELFMRWDLADKLREKNLFPKDYPIRGVWCSKLNGETYATAGSEDQFDGKIVAQKAMRLPLYMTENVLRERLKDFSSVSFFKNSKVESFIIKNNHVEVSANKKQFLGKYVIGCDGANSVTRENINIPFKGLSPKRRVLNVLFEAPDLAGMITVEKGFIYYIMGNPYPAPMGPVDITRGIWYAQLFIQDSNTEIEDIQFEKLFFEITGIKFNLKILNAHFWDMQIQCAESFSKDNRAFLVGDAAHAFAPTGGFGLNTGLGDVTNLAWKLSAVIQHSASVDLLKTYEIERRPICLTNLHAAEKNANDAIMVRTQFPPEKDPQKFAQENARIAKQHTYSGGLTLGYTYDQNEKPMNPSKYIPIVKSGYFLPNKEINDQSIYQKLSPTHWTLIVCGKEKIKINMPQLKILHIPERVYPSRYILIRPDWHIVLAQDELIGEEAITLYN